MKITGHTYSVTIRSQLETKWFVLSALRQTAASPEFTQEHCVFAEHLSSADSSYLNRPIVGPTPPKLPASWSSNLRHHRAVLRCLSQNLNYITISRPLCQGDFTNFSRKFCGSCPMASAPFFSPSERLYIIGMAFLRKAPAFAAPRPTRGALFSENPTVFLRFPLIFRALYAL